jgi:hypothetical protein
MIPDPAKPEQLVVEQEFSYYYQDFIDPEEEPMEPMSDFRKCLH